MKSKGSPAPLRKAILLAAQTPKDSEATIQRSLGELELLVRDLGFDVTHRVMQKRENRTSATYLGEGKLEEVARITGGPGKIARGPESADLEPEGGREYTVIVDDELSPGQQRNLESALGADILDRVTVILRVFERRARTHESKLQIELAKLEYQLPRVRDDHSLGDQEGGGGRAARGHSNVELAKQRIRHRIAQLKREIEKLTRAPAEKSEVFQVALIGYTNAGKSSMMRMLTKSGVLVEDKLFATLGTTTRQLMPPSVPRILVTDTVGFIDRLPHGLIASFRSTLAQASDAWLILQVIDAADPNWRAHAEVTDRVLKEIGLSDKPVWWALNKIDKLSEAERKALASEFPDAVQVSALNPEDMKGLRQKIVDYQNHQLQESRFSLTYDQYRILTDFRDHVQIVSEDYADTISVSVRSTPTMLAKLRSRLAG